MIYLLNELDFDNIAFNRNRYVEFTFFRTYEHRVKGWIKNERTRTIIEKKEVVNFFSIKEKVQMGKATKIELKKFDKLIIFTSKNNFYVLEVIGFKD